MDGRSTCFVPPPTKLLNSPFSHKPDNIGEMCMRHSYSYCTPSVNFTGSAGIMRKSAEVCTPKNLTSQDCTSKIRPSTRFKSFENFGRSRADVDYKPASLQDYRRSGREANVGMSELWVHLYQTRRRWVSGARGLRPAVSSTPGVDMVQRY